MACHREVADVACEEGQPLSSGQLGGRKPARELLEQFCRYFFFAAFLTFFVTALAFFFAAVTDFFTFDFALPKDLGIAFAILGAFAPAAPPTTAPIAAPIGPTNAPAAAPAAAPPTIPAPDIDPFFAAFFFAMECFP